MSRNLPPTFTSLYRLFLRSTAASVLYKRPAVKRLRQAWRPVFEGAARIVRRLQDGPTSESERNKLQRWYSLWESRMDETLSLLTISARSRGLPHRITRNMNFLLKAHKQFLKLKSAGVSSRQWWNPTLPPDSERYQPKTVIPGSRAGNKADTAAKFLKLDHDAWGALGEVVIMAEGRDRLSLGRIKNE
ncbi:uncharacterized protein LAESUDRAFT_738068 [Laetiporus sulphureus 93-53]|uniref:Uncharacterized protein n=1 Tax=Laetiporus sulphureus 93-53 TaxID=1314785 RepID=A0A165D153_9APHY|nr:uncharacterized protein LAESUDRAFT_738068 [Laetiporus sulphureus 93-53]KZT03931.1 hypothetical protein LAESUDRAFT_738068 [Laetiporus sulphureus 93-53]